jgi:hypothetical protein
MEAPYSQSSWGDPHIKTHQVAEPTHFATQRRIPSRLERDLATFIVNMEYAA